MFEIKEVSTMEATGAKAWAYGLGLSSFAGSVLLLSAALAC